MWQQEAWLDLWFSNICCIRITWNLIKTQVPVPLPQIQEVWVEPENSSKFPFDADAAGRTTLWEPLNSHFCELGHGTYPPWASMPTPAKAQSWLILFGTIPPALCLKVCLVIKPELPKVHITFLNADSESDPMLISHCISNSSLVNWLQSQQDRT